MLTPASWVPLQHLTALRSWRDRPKCNYTRQIWVLHLNAMHYRPIKLQRQGSPPAVEICYDPRESSGKPNSLPVSKCVEDDRSCHFHFCLCVLACASHIENKRKNSCGLEWLKKGYTKEKILIALVLIFSYSMSNPNKFNDIVNGIKNYIKNFRCSPYENSQLKELLFKQ